MQRELRDLITRAVLMANELIHDEINPPRRTGSPADLMASEIRSKTSILENPHVLLARTAAFFEWCKDSSRTRSANELPVESDFHEMTGLTPEEYAAGAYAVLSRAAVIREPINISRSAVFFTLDQWLSQIKQKSVPRQWIEVSSLPIEEAQADWKSEPSLSFAAGGKLWRRPVVRDSEQFFVPSPRLVWNALGDGTYFTLFDGYKGANREKFSRFYSEFFEDYIRKLIEDAYARRQDASVTRSFKYRRNRQQVESSDILITENSDVIFVEIVAKRLNFIGSVLRLDLGSIESDIRRGILCKAKQLHDNITDYRAGVLLPDNPRPKNQRLFPVIVSPKDWPRIQILTTFWPDEQAQKKLLLDAEPLEILDADEIEILQPMLSGGIRFADLLDRKNRPPASHHSSRMQSMHDYLVLSTVLPRPSWSKGQTMAAFLFAVPPILVLALFWFLGSSSTGPSGTTSDSGGSPTQEAQLKALLDTCKTASDQKKDARSAYNACNSALKWITTDLVATPAAADRQEYSLVTDNALIYKSFASQRLGWSDQAKSEFARA